MKKIAVLVGIVLVFGLVFSACDNPAGNEQSVVPPAPSGVVVSPDIATVARDGTQTFTAAVEPEGASQTVAWSVNPAGAGSFEGNVLTIASDAQLGDITVMATAAGTEVYGTATVTVTEFPPPAPENVIVSPAAVELERDGTQTFTATVNPEGASQAVSWSVVPAEAGSFTGNVFTVASDAQLGDITITATATGTEAYGTATVTVIELSLVDRVRAVAAGRNHTVVIREDGTLWSWGNSQNGVLGDGGTAGVRNAPFRIGTGRDWVYVAAALEHNLAIRADGSLWAWGSRAHGKLGVGTTSGTQTSPINVQPGTTWASVSTFLNHSAGIMTDGSLWVWGVGLSGQIGDGATSSRSVPTNIKPGTTWKAVAVGNGYTTGIMEDGTLWAWGNNANGRTGLGTMAGNTTTPTQVQPGTTWKAVAAGDNHTLAVMEDGTLWSWGSNAYSQLGLGGLGGGSSPRQIGTESDWVSVAASGGHSLAVREDGSLWAWGNNRQGQIGDGTGGGRFDGVGTPAHVYPGTAWISVSAGENHTVALRSDNTFWIWGDGRDGQLGVEGYGVREAPTPVKPGTEWQVVSAGQRHTVALRADGTIWAWGYNIRRQLGQGMEQVGTNTPVQVGTDSDWVYVTAGWEYNMAIRADGSLWGWGDGGNGRIGDCETQAAGVGGDRPYPVPVAPGTTWRTVAAGRMHTFGIQTDGTLWAWGSNGQGRLGVVAGGTQLLVPTQVMPGTTWKAVAAGTNSGTAPVGHSLGIQADGTLWAWGSNQHGRLGDGTETNRSPLRIGEATDWVSVAAGDQFSVGVRGNGTLWGWGNTTGGRTAVGPSPSNAHLALTPRQAPGSGWTSVSASRGHSVAIRDDGSLWTWGVNDYWQILGVTAGSSRDPVRIGTETGWSSPTAGGDHSAALRADGSLWVWGSNNEGQFGDGTMPWSLVPVQVIVQ